MSHPAPLLCCCRFLRSEKADWQNKKAMYDKDQDKLDEQRQVDAVKIQELNVG